MIVQTCTLAGFALGSVVVTAAALFRSDDPQEWAVVRVVISTTLLGFAVGLAVLNP